jgi:hypothetical protein
MRKSSFKIPSTPINVKDYKSQYVASYEKKDIIEYSEKKNMHVNLHCRSNSSIENGACETFLLRNYLKFKPAEYLNFSYFIFCILLSSITFLYLHLKLRLTPLVLNIINKINLRARPSSLK